MPPQRAKILDRRGEIFRERYLPTLKPFDRTRELLERIASDGVKLVVATSAGEEDLKGLLTQAGIEDLIDMVETVASCELYGLLKRPDEKYVTEKAYDNPKFVEDMVRDVAILFNKDERIRSYTVESENFESIHNHSAYAMLRNTKS